jgi:hypothetical protein
MSQSEVDNLKRKLDMYTRAVEFHNALCKQHKAPEWAIDISKLNNH